MGEVSYVLILDEIHPRMALWIENRDRKSVTLAIGGSLTGGARCFITEYDCSIALEETEYNVTWRAWSQKPTNEQMLSEPWD